MSVNIDFSTMSDEDLENLRVVVNDEVDRRYRRSTIPAQIQQLKALYIQEGGDPADLPADGVTPE